MSFDFDGIENAEVFERGSYFPPDGTFYIKVNRTLAKNTQRSGAAFIAEFEVIHSTLDSVKAGTKKSWYQSLKDKNVAFPAILEFMAALLGIDTKDKEVFADFKTKIKEILNEAGNFEGQDEDHPLHGETIMVTTWEKKTQKDTDFTVHDWAIWTEEDGWED